MSLKLWTIQSLDQWEKFQQCGVLRTDGRHVNPYWRPAYQWMMREMAQRLPAYSGLYPVWAWYLPKPDLRGSAHRSPGTLALRIECLVSKERILLSDFEEWNNMLDRVRVRPTQREVNRIFSQRGNFTQAILEEIRIEEVVEVREFKAR